MELGGCHFSFPGRRFEPEPADDGLALWPLLHCNSPFINLNSLLEVRRQVLLRPESSRDRGFEGRTKLGENEGCQTSPNCAVISICVSIPMILFFQVYNEGWSGGLGAGIPSHHSGFDSQLGWLTQRTTNSLPLMNDVLQGRVSIDKKITII